jgi:DDE superfamily endonuclease
MPPALPDSLARLLSLLRPAFTAASFDTFCWLVHGFIGRVGEHTITGVWRAARLAGVLHHSRAHDFFARRRWSADRLGLALAAFVVGRFLAPDEPIPVAIDDTLFPRAGAKVFAAGWQFDSAAPLHPTRRLRFGNSFVCLGVLIRLHGRTVCLPLLFRLWRPAAGDAEAVTRVALAHELIARLGERFAGRAIAVAADAYYANRRLRELPEGVSACVRLRANAALWQLPPAPAGRRRGRPRTKGERLGPVRELAAASKARWTELRVTTAAGEQRRLEALVLDCLWYKVLGPRPVRVVIAREPGRPELPLLALLSTDPALSAAEILRRFGERWAIEVAFAEAKGQLGVGEARNRVPAAVERTVPFGFLCRALVLVWYALNGDADADVAQHRSRAPWYRQKRSPSFADMLVALRRELIRAEFRADSIPAPTPPENDALSLAARILQA